MGDGDGEVAGLVVVGDLEEVEAGGEVGGGDALGGECGGGGLGGVVDAALGVAEGNVEGAREVGLEVEVVFGGQGVGCEGLEGGGGGGGGY